MGGSTTLISNIGIKEGTDKKVGSITQEEASETIHIQRFIETPYNVTPDNVANSDFMSISKFLCITYDSPIVYLNILAAIPKYYAPFFMKLGIIGYTSGGGIPIGKAVYDINFFDPFHYSMDEANEDFNASGSKLCSGVITDVKGSIKGAKYLKIYPIGNRRDTFGTPFVYDEFSPYYLRVTTYPSIVLNVETKDTYDYDSN